MMRLGAIVVLCSVLTTTQTLGQMSGAHERARSSKAEVRMPQATLVHKAPTQALPASCSTCGHHVPFRIKVPRAFHHEDTKNTKDHEGTSGTCLADTGQLFNCTRVRFMSPSIR